MGLGTRQSWDCYDQYKLTLLMYRYAVRYHLSEDPKLLKSTEVPEVSKAHSARVSLSPDARVVAVSVDQEETSSIYIYPTASDAERISMIDIHKGMLIKSLSVSHTHTHTFLLLSRIITLSILHFIRGD